MIDHPDISIKKTEQEDVFGGALEYTIKSGSQRVPCQFKRALRSAQYKKQLTVFFVQTWADDIYSQYIRRRTVYVTAGHTSYKLSADIDVVQCVVQDNLKCQHEEAYTIIILDAVHDSAECDLTIVLRSPDTDVLVIPVHVCALQLESLPLIFRVQYQRHGDKWKCHPLLDKLVLLCVKHCLACMLLGVVIQQINLLVVGKRQQ